MTDEEFATDISALVRETPRVEFKGPGRGDDRQLMARVVRAVMAMSNRTDGGTVVIGVADDGTALSWDGISDGDLPTWNADHVGDRVAAYADPPPTLEVSTPRANGKTFVVIEVEEFGDVPVICKRSYEGVLRDGATYVRPRRKPESVEVPTSADMRDLLDLASEKMARRLLGRAERLGLTPPPETSVDDAARFQGEIQDLIQ